MNKNFHMSVEEILKAASAAQRILWNDIFQRLGERVAISQLHYSGVIAGSEFETYSSTKMYFAYSFSLGSSQAGVPNINPASLYLYNRTNVLAEVLHNNSLAWDATAAGFKAVPLSLQVENKYFSRIAIGALYSSISFIGFRISG